MKVLSEKDNKTKTSERGGRMRKEESTGGGRSRPVRRTGGLFLKLAAVCCFIHGETGGRRPANESIK